jgi:hypothetical protein
MIIYHLAYLAINKQSTLRSVGRIFMEDEHSVFPFLRLRQNRHVGQSPKHVELSGMTFVRSVPD